MSSVLPRSIHDRIAYFENHIATWNGAATQIGTTVAAVAALDTKTQAARAAFDAQQLAYDNAKSATLALHQAVEAMMTAGADIIKQVKTQAAITGPSVYTLANIPEPAIPSPVGAPGTPYQLKVTLNPNGSLHMSWKCDNPAGSSGTLYHIYRKVGTAPAEFAFIGGSGSRAFTDQTVPAGAPTIVYQIQAARTTAVGVAGEFIVNLGTGAGGEMTASVSQTPSSPKMAA